MSAHQRDRLC